MARPASSSALDGTLPPDNAATASSRPSEARVSPMVAVVCATLACALVKAACERRIWSRSFAVSSTTRTCPFLTRPLTSTFTSNTVLDSSLPMLIDRLGCTVPLAMKLRVRSPRVTGWVV